MDLERGREGKEPVEKEMVVVGMVRAVREKAGLETDLVGLDLAGGGWCGAKQT